MLPQDKPVPSSQVITTCNSSPEAVETIIMKARGTSTSDPPAIDGSTSVPTVSSAPAECRPQRYPSMPELGDILLASLKAHEMLWSRGILHRNITFQSVMTLATARYDDNPEVLEALYRAGDLGGLQEDVNETKVTAPQDDVFADSDVGSQTNLRLFMASELLRSSTDRRTQPGVQHTVSHDLESFDWVALYAIYRHALQTLPAGIWHPLYGPLLREFTRLFTTTSTRTLLEGRALAFGIEDSGNLKSSRHRQSESQSISVTRTAGRPNPRGRPPAIADSRTGVERAPAICGGIRSLTTYAAEVAKSKRLNAFLIAIWTELKVTFEGPPWRAPRPQDRHMREAYRYIARRFSNAPAVVRGIGIIDVEGLEDDNADEEDEEVENADRDSEGVDAMNGESSHGTATGAPVRWGYTYEDLGRKLGIFVGKEISLGRGSAEKRL